MNPTDGLYYILKIPVFDVYIGMWQGGHGKYA